MSEIPSIDSSAGVRPVQPNLPARPATEKTVSSEAKDTVEISPEARLASLVAQVPAVRKDLVERVKSEIAAGTYDTQQKMDIALERLMDEQNY